jgi:hypothetical protein
VSWRSVAVAASGAFAAGCSGAITLTVAGDLPVPSGVDAICVGVADRDVHGGQFGRAYRLEGALASLPQTLAVEPGGASSADAWVLGYHGGTVVALDQAAVSFDGDVTLRLDRCKRGRAGTPTVAAMDAAASSSRIVRSIGQGGQVAVAIGDGSAHVLGSGLAELGTFAPTGAVTDVAVLDADGDCDEDLVIATDGGPPHLWLRTGVSFADAGAIGATTVRAVAAADVDADGDVDLVLGGGATLALYRNDGGGHFMQDAAAFAGGGGASDVTSIAAGDLDGDGRTDLVIGQGSANAAPLYALYGSGAGFASAPGALPAVSLKTARVALADADGDGDLDLALALVGAPARLYVNRGGALEDQSFVRLPQPAPMAQALAFVDWDDDCDPDLAAAASDATHLARGGDGGAFTDDGTAPAAGDAAFADLDGDGVPELVTAAASGVTLVTR